MGRSPVFHLRFLLQLCVPMEGTSHQKNRQKVFKRTSYKIGTKIELLDLYHNNKDQFKKTLSQRKINPTTFIQWLRTEEKLRAKAKSADITTVRRYRDSPLRLVDDGLYRWFLETRAAEPHRRLTDEDLLIHANQILDKLVESGVVRPKLLSDRLGPYSDFQNQHKNKQSDTSEQDETSSSSTDTDNSESSVAEIIRYPNTLDCYHGVKNSGTDCYIIVIIQLLFFHSQFRKLIIATDPDNHYFPFNLSTARRYFATTDMQQIRMGSLFQLEPLNSFTRFATLTSSELCFFRKALTDKQASLLLQSFEALRYTFARLCEPSPPPKELAPVLAQVPVQQTLSSKSAPSKTPFHMAPAEWKEFLAVSAQKPRIAQFNKTAILSFQQNPTNFTLQYGSRFKTSTPISLKHFLILYTDSNGKRIPHGQQDPHEFLLLLLDTLTLYFYTYGLPLVTRKLFWMITSETFICSNKHRVKQTDIGTFVLTVPILSSSTLTDSLRQLHTEGHEVQSECKHCSSMYSIEPGKHVPCKCLLSFKQLPNSVLFMLQRYITGPSGAYKLRKRFTFPVEDTLDLSPFSLKTPPSTGSPMYQTYLNYHTYRLASVICHHGDIDAGHYVAFIKERQPPSRWLMVNDEGIMAVPIASVTDMLFSTEDPSLSPSSIVSGYILCYERVTPVDEFEFERRLLTKVCPTCSYQLFSYANGDDITLTSKIVVPLSLDYDGMSASSTLTDLPSITDADDSSSHQHSQQLTHKRKKTEGDTSSSQSSELTESTLLAPRRHNPDSPLLHTPSPASDSEGSPSYARECAAADRRPVQISRSWIYRWKMRHGIRYRRFFGESGDSDIAAGNLWVATELASLKQRYSPENIFNADETGLFYKRLPSGGLTFKTEVLRGRRVNKSRVTVLVAASSVGEKLPLLVIGRNKHKKQLQGNTFTLRYLQNNSAWMTTDIFTDWLESVNAQMILDRRFIVMVVDNCSAHRVTKQFSNVALVYLPPCVTATHQPCDAGIISLLKRKYHRTFLEVLYGQRRRGEPVSVDSISFLLTLRHLESAWQAIPAQYIANCFTHAWKKQDDKEIQPLQINEETEPNQELGRFVRDNIAHLSFPRENDYTIEPLSEKSIVRDISKEVETGHTITSSIPQSRQTEDPTPHQITDAATLLLSAIQSGKVDSDGTLKSSLETIREVASQQKAAKCQTSQITLDHYFKKLHDEKPP